MPDFYLQTGRDHRGPPRPRNFELEWWKNPLWSIFFFFFEKGKMKWLKTIDTFTQQCFFFSVCWTKSLERQCRSESKYKYHNDKLLTREQLQNVLVGTDFALILSGTLIKTPARISIGRRKST